MRKKWEERIGEIKREGLDKIKMEENDDELNEGEGN